MYTSPKQITIFLSMNIAIIVLSLVFTIPVVQMVMNNFTEAIVEIGIILITIAGIQTIMNVAFYKWFYINNLNSTIKATLRFVIGSLCVTIFLTGMYALIFYFKNP